MMAGLKSPAAPRAALAANPSRTGISRGEREAMARSLSGNRHRGQGPDVGGVFADGAVAGELPHPRGIEDGAAAPGLGVAIGEVHPRLAVRIGSVVGQDLERVAPVEERVVQRAEGALLAGGPVVAAEPVDD